MKCGICGEAFTANDWITEVRYLGARIFAHLTDCSLRRDGNCGESRGYQTVTEARARALL